MRGVVISRPGGPEVLVLQEDLEAPVPGPHDVRIRVMATAVNRADLLQRRGGYPAPSGAPAAVPGLEYAGLVDRCGDRVTRWQEGDRVMGIVPGGGYAEHVTVNEGEALPVPARLTYEQAAAIPEVFLTAHDALFTQAGLGAGDTVLVHAVGSGVGTAAVQLIRAAGARSLGTARSAWKLERATDLGLDVGIDVTDSDFAEVVRHETADRGVDVILDLVGGDYLDGNLRAAASGARIIVVGLVAGARAMLDMRALLGRRITLRGTVMRTRTVAEKVAVADAFRRAALPLFDEGRLQPVIDSVLPVAEAARAHALLEADETFGKVVLTWSDGAGTR